MTTTETDPMPALYAEGITGVRRINGTWVYYEATASDDGRTITVTNTWRDLTTDTPETVTRTVLHVTPAIPVPPPAPVSVTVTATSAPTNGHTTTPDPITASRHTTADPQTTQAWTPAVPTAGTDQ